MKKGRIILLFVMLGLIAAFFYFDAQQYLNLTYLKSQQAALQQYYLEHTLQTISLYFAIYVLVTALSLPGATIMTLLGGAIFGLATGLLLVSFASTIGASIAFIASRFLFKAAIENKFGDKLKTINQGIENEGAFYLFTLRLVPIFPFFVINLAMGLTSLRLWTFYWVSQVGMFAGTIVYVFAGTELGKIESLKGILSPTLWLSFALLGTFPLVAKKIVEHIKNRRQPNHSEDSAT